jgi:3-oxoacyl-[acyl-carrier protein] reductase
MNFEGKRAIVTGGAQGIGRAVVEQLLEAGALVLIFDRDERSARATLGELGDHGGRLMLASGDVATRSAVRAAVDKVVERWGGLDVMIAHAGLGAVEPFLEIADESWRNIIEVNVHGAFTCVQEAARAMVSAGGGSIVVTGSTNAFWVESHTAHYNASKGAAVTLVRSAALDLAPYGIRVNAVDPGLIRSGLSRYITEDPEHGAEYLARIPLGRFGEVTDVARAILFLASSDAAWITGAELVVDGGQTLGTPLPLPDDAPPVEATASVRNATAAGQE